MLYLCYWETEMTLLLFVKRYTKCQDDKGTQHYFATIPHMMQHVFMFE